MITALGAFLLLNAFGLLGTFVGLVIMHVMMALPLVVVTMTAALRQLGESLNLRRPSAWRDAAQGFPSCYFSGGCSLPRDQRHLRVLHIVR